MSTATGNANRLITFIAVLCLALATALGHAGPIAHEPVVSDLIQLLDTRPALKRSLESAIDDAGAKGINDLTDFYTYLDELITWIPVEREIIPRALKLYYIVNQAPGDTLNEDQRFSAWMNELVQAWGDFLDTPASAAGRRRVYGQLAQ